MLFPDLEQKLFWPLAKFFSALLSNLQLAYPEDHSDTFSELSLNFEPSRDMSSNCWEFLLKNFSTVYSKLNSSCTDEHFERKILIEVFFSFLPLLEFIEKKVSGFWRRTSGTVVQTAFYVCRQKFVSRRKKIPEG